MINSINFIIYILIFFVGASFGSFSGVIVDRLYIKSFIKGSSVCQSCSRKLNWYEMIPVFSYLFLKGRCKKCSVKIGVEHFFLELIGGIIAIFLYKTYLINYFIDFSFNKNTLIGILLTIFFLFLFVIFSVIFVYDMRHKLVPTSFSLILLLSGLAFEAYRAFNYTIFYGGINTLFWFDLFSGFLIALPFFLIYIFSKKRAVGIGDIMIFLGVGYLSGFVFGVSIFVLSIWIGAAFSLFLMYLKPKKYNKKSQIPFAPFILIATILIMILQLDLFGLFIFFK